MRRVIRHLRSQPERIRVQILYFLTIACAFVLLLVWASRFGISTSQPSTRTGVEGSLQPLSVLKDNAIEGARNLEAPW
ncbi:MAG: hypothetical protein KBC44_02310 [Candidatus Pacebacteria bacterium]|nr:hypothetical protein [Candidatus Paceibacterota bacterium]MBP9839791.1 hypothetical protein [Candidatus Paceibacterota bacterium]